MARNPDGQGRKPHKIKRGGWRAYLTVGYKPDGKPIRKYVYGKTQGEVLTKLDEARRLANLGVTDPGSLTVDQYLDEWLASKAAEVSPSTLRIYTSELAHLRPHIGKARLAKLRPADVRRVMRALPGTVVEYGRKGKGKQSTVLTARAANMARRVLASALADAVRDGLIAVNPASSERVKPLKHEERDVQVWTAAQVTAFLDACLAGGCVLYPYFYTALTTGLRVGELAALRWDDLTDSTLRVERSADASWTKTPAGRRTLPLPADTRQVLEKHRADLRASRIDSPLVFPTSSGGPVSRHYARKSLALWSGKAGVPRRTPHELRHTYASMMISAGVNPAELARLLGHTNPAFTLRRYVHFFELAQPREAPTLRELTGSQGGAVGGAVHSPD